MSSALSGDEGRYTSSEEHLSDVLEWLNLTLFIQVLKNSKRAEDPMENMRGLVISKQEIAEILSPGADASGSAEFAEMANRRADLEGRIARKTAVSKRLGVFLALPHLERAFQLSDFEQKCLVICFACAADANYEKIYAFLHEDVTRKKPTVELIARLFCRDFVERAAALRCFSASTPFSRLVLAADQPGGDPLASMPLQLDQGIVSYLAGNRGLDARMEQFAKLFIHGERANVPFPDTEEDMSPYVRQIKSGEERFLTTGEKTVFCVSGPRGSGKRPFARRLGKASGTSLLLVDLQNVPGDMPLGSLFLMAERQAALERAIVCFCWPEALADRERAISGREFAKACVKLRVPTVIVVSEEDPAHLFLYEDVACVQKTFAIPADPQRADLFRRCARRLKLKEGADPGAFAAKYRFSAGQIERAVAKAAQIAEMSPGPDKRVGNAELSQACKLLSLSKLEQYGQRIRPKYSFEDIVLPGFQLSQLKAICDHVNYRHIVFGEWGLDEKHTYGNGLHALFFGPSGTGKTMAAEILSNELSLELFRIDLSLVVSKYIGETEKNLKAVFDEAVLSNAILFFDEADALFGKRTEIKDSHDRHANVEVAYLLQRMEAYGGVTILATNMLNNMDEAFARRMSFSVEFPFPDERNRKTLWAKAFPPGLPTADDIDLGFLARSFELSGGNIKNIVLRSAFAAAGEGAPVMMRHLVPAVRSEFIKMNKPVMRADFGEFAALLYDSGDAHE